MLTPVIARLDRATQYSALSESHMHGGDYWVPACAGMTYFCAAAARIMTPDMQRLRHFKSIIPDITGTQRPPI